MNLHWFIHFFIGLACCHAAVVAFAALVVATGVVVVLRMVAVAAVLGMLIGEGSRIGELR